MMINLDTLLPDVFDSIKERGLTIFHCELRALDPPSAVYWDVAQHPGFDGFLDAAVSGGAKIIALYSHRFSEDQIEEAIMQLEDSEVEMRERREIEKELRNLRMHKGRVSQIEMTFTHGSREYVFDVRADWFDEYTDLIDRIETSFMVTDDDSPLDGGYFSKN